VPAWEHFLTTLTSSRNLWFDPKTPNSFRIGGVGFNLADWSKITGQDTSSLFADPKLSKVRLELFERSRLRSVANQPAAEESLVATEATRDARYEVLYATPH
jgi:hypothetical protein